MLKLHFWLKYAAIFLRSAPYWVPKPDSCPYELGFEKSTFASWAKPWARCRNAERSWLGPELASWFSALAPCRNRLLRLFGLLRSVLAWALFTFWYRFTRSLQDAAAGR